MKTTLHIALILLLGLASGLVIRSFRSSQSSGPGPDDVVFSNDAPDVAESNNDVESLPSHPPKDEEWLSRFELTERSGEQVSSEDLLGQPYVVSFFFSTCPSICVQQNQKLQELQDEFAGQGVRFVAISVDPETDTPERLREYAARFGADKDQWLFMTGDLTYIRRVGAEVFMQHADKKVHSERFVLVDAKGAIEGFYNWPEKLQFTKLREKIRDMIESKDS
ncbi:MAG: SCO family protein [Rubripirellula sp.]